MAQPVVERLAPPAAGLIALLGMEPNPATAAISRFAGNAQLSPVSQAFQRHNLHGMQGELREIRMTGEASMRMIHAAEADLPPDVRSVEVLAQEIRTKLVSSPMLNQLEFEVTKDTLQRIWWRCEELRSSLSQEEAERTGPLWQKALHAFNQHLTGAEHEYLQNQPNRVRTLNLNLNLASSDLRVLCARIGLVHRCNQVIESRRLDPNTHREDAARCFQALHASQRAAAAAYASGDAAYALHQTKMQQDRLRTSFTLERFLDLESRIQDTESQERCYNMNRFWGALGFGAIPYTAFERSLWLRDPAHALTLARINGGALNLTNILHFDTDLSAIPDEIETLTGLQNLFISTEGEGNRLRGLPETFGNLQGLSMLTLTRQDFYVLPDSLARLPRLSRFEIIENRHPIRVFPEPLARKQYGGFVGLLQECLDASFNLKSWDRDPRAPVGALRHYAWLPQNDFTDVPFFLWFRENFSLPYLHVVMREEEWPESWVHCFKWFMSTLERISPLLMIPVVIPLLVFALTKLLLNVPIFLFNLFVNLVIEPIVTFVRENLLGYSPMVHIRDIPGN